MSEPMFWTCRDMVTLTWTDIDDAIEEALDGIHPDPIPDELEVRGYDPKEVDIKREAEAMLDRFGEQMNEEYGDPDGYGTFRPTDSMRDAAETFVRAFVKEYNVWSCVQVTTQIVNAREWCAKNRPEWLEQEEAEDK